MNFLFVGLGGAVGAMLRYSLSLIPCKTSFPFITLITNIAGALVIGLITGFAAKRNMSDNTMLFLKTGLCGGFTTFSTFSLEAYNLFQSGSCITAIVYALLSAALCILGVWAGILISGIVVKG